MRLNLLFGAILLAPVLRSQTVTVKGNTHDFPLQHVQIHARSGSPIFTAEDGTADLSNFVSKDSLWFELAGYTTQVLVLEELKNSSWQVKLNSQHKQLNEVVVPVSLWERGFMSQPLRTERITAKGIAFQNPQTAADVLASSAYVFVQKSQLGGGSPMLRGMATNRVLLVIDGVRMNNAIFRSGNLQNVISLDAAAIEETEVIFGPGSVMYGSDAIGGVMNFKTLSPKFADTASSRLQVKGNAMLRGSTANSEFTQHLDLSLSHNRWASSTSITHARYGDLRGGRNGGVNSFYRSTYVTTISGRDTVLRNADSSLQVGSGYSQINFIQKILFRPTRHVTLDYGLHVSQTSNYNRYDRLYVVQKSGPYKNKLRWAEWYYGPQIWNMHRLGITHALKTRAYDQLQVIVALQNFEESRYDREFMSTDKHIQQENVRALSFNLDLKKKIGERLFLNYGFEALHNRVSSVGNTEQIYTGMVTPAVSRYPDGSTWEALALYFSGKKKISDHFMLQAGLRYSYIQTKAKFDTTFFPFPFTTSSLQNGTPSGSIGFIFSPKRHIQIYSNLATSFRAPNIDDIGKVFESSPGYLIVPNPSLKAEYGYNAEAGFVESFGDFLKVDGAGYYTLLKNAMERGPYLFNGQSSILYLGKNSEVQAVQNISAATVYGVQAGVEIHYRYFSLRSNWSWQKGFEKMKDSVNSFPLRHAAPAFGSTHLTFQKRKIRLEFYAVYNKAMTYEELALTERVNVSYARDYSVDPKGRAYLAAWYTLNFKVALQLHPRFYITAGVENISDQLYRPYSSGINAPGRNFILSLRGNF